MNCFEEYAAGDIKLLEYHKEYGRLIKDEEKVIELFILECFQAGLSWKTILYKRENFRSALDNFDIYKIAKYDLDKIDELMHNKGIIRNKAKIVAMINNAKIILKIKEEYGSFSNYLWSIVDNEPVIENNELNTLPISDDLSKELYKRGMRFVGSITLLSFLKAIGIVYPHSYDCDIFKEDNAIKYLQHHYHKKV